MKEGEVEMEVYKISFDAISASQMFSMVGNLKSDTQFKISIEVSEDQLPQILKNLPENVATQIVRQTVYTTIEQKPSEMKPVNDDKEIGHTISLSPQEAAVFSVFKGGQEVTMDRIKSILSAHSYSPKSNHAVISSLKKKQLIRRKENTNNYVMT